jgi:hypothetical protein
MRATRIKNSTNFSIPVGNLDTRSISAARKGELRHPTLCIYDAQARVFRNFTHVSARAGCVQIFFFLETQVAGATLVFLLGKERPP